jgi:arylamine N-acetyltransferase
MTTAFDTIHNGHLVLHPEAHAAPCGHFFSHFNLPSQPKSLNDLQIILAAFASLPYENLSKIIRLHQHGEDAARLRLPEDVFEDHRRWNLGGTCFSLTFFLHALLLHRGYACYPVMADMRAGCNVHCALIVRLDGAKYLTDPGYVLDRPLLVEPAHLRTYHTEFTGVELRFDAAAQRFHLNTFNQRETKWRYSFVDRPTPQAEFLAHWQASFSRNSMHALCLSRARRDGLLYIHGAFMRESSWQGKRNRNIRNTMHRAIEENFGIPAALVEQAQAALQENLRRERNGPHRALPVL